MGLKRYLFFLVLLAGVAPAAAQHPASYPQSYFRNPLGIPMLLAGNFGECRPGHFHSGIDIKTLGKENQPVYAAADGYISRVKMEPGGFGHAIYITHPNGYTTLYAHLNDFMPRLQQHVRALQYKNENWELDEKLEASLFPVQKGQQIAWSGNTGGSTAPHLHFEIRDTETEHPLNPLLFGFRINDQRAPLPKQLALYDLGTSIYEQGPVLKLLKKKGTFYVPATDTLDATGSFTGLGLVVDDYMNGSDNTLAFYTVEWYLDEEPMGRIRLDDIGYDETRYLHAYADYKTKKKSGNWVQCLFRVPGNGLEHIYEDLRYESPAGHKGVLHPGDGGVHAVRIVLEDAAGNESGIRFWLRFPDAGQSLSCRQIFHTGKANSPGGNHPNIAFSLDTRALYDDICFSMESRDDAGAYSPRFQVQTAEVPVHTYYDLQIRPSKPVPFALRGKIALVYSDGRTESGKAATADARGWYKASVRNFGSYRLMADTAGPVIKSLTPVTTIGKGSKIVFSVKDKITDVSSLRGTLDGQWLLFEQHGDTWTYRMDDHCPKGSHELTVQAVDENGNATEQRYRFIR